MTDLYELWYALLGLGYVLAMLLWGPVLRLVFAARVIREWLRAKAG